MITIVDQTGSTNADLAEGLRAGEAMREGDWLVANYQTAGKGRQGRPWKDGVGNFMGSTIVHLGDATELGSTLNFPVSLALYGAIKDCSPDLENLLLKWPNDVLLDGAKLSGILMELVGNSVVVGIGVNLVHAPDLPDRKTAALADYGPAPNRDHFAERLAFHLDQELSCWREFGEEPMRNRWNELAHPIGTHLSVHDVDGSRVEGHFEGLAPGGAMMLRLADGESRAIHSGDVSLA